MTDRELLEFVAAQVGGLTGEVKNLNSKFDNLDKKVDSLEKQVAKIEVEHGNKLDALLDGYKQNSEKIARIEEEVTKHEEIIIKRVK